MPRLVRTLIYVERSKNQEAQFACLLKTYIYGHSREPLPPHSSYSLRLAVKLCDGENLHFPFVQRRIRNGARTPNRAERRCCAHKQAVRNNVSTYICIFFHVYKVCEPCVRHACYMLENVTVCVSSVTCWLAGLTKAHTGNALHVVCSRKWFVSGYVKVHIHSNSTYMRFVLTCKSGIEMMLKMLCVYFPDR